MRLPESVYDVISKHERWSSWSMSDLRDEEFITDLATAIEALVPKMSAIVIRTALRNTETGAIHDQVWECMPEPGNFIKIEPSADYVVDSIRVEAPQRLTPG